MFAEIIAIGTELTSGAKLDTNSQWLSLELAEVGLTVRAHLTISDDLDGMSEAIRSAAAPGRAPTIHVAAPDSDVVAPLTEETEAPDGGGNCIGGWGAEAIATVAIPSMAIEKVASRSSSRGN